MRIFFFFLFLGLPCSLYAQGLAQDPSSLFEDDLNIGGDIFSDFNENIDSAQVAEDERFFRYGRFFSVQVSVGLTTFDGNRGTAYENDPPSYGLGVNYFSDFRSSYGLGFEFSKHHMFLDEETQGFNNGTAAPNGPGSGIGLVDVSMLRVYYSYRYYIDTADLGTAITYANPYFTARLEYWYVTNKFLDQEGIIPEDSGGGLGLGLGFGGEFPIKLKESYLGVEFLFHSVNFHDRLTQLFRPVSFGSGFGFDDLTGNVYSTMVSYVISW
jgi:hypothetical protein